MSWSIVHFVVPYDTSLPSDPTIGKIGIFPHPAGANPMPNQGACAQGGGAMAACGRRILIMLPYPPPTFQSETVRRPIVVKWPHAC
jgi:hypothetical protein